MISWRPLLILEDDLVDEVHCEKAVTGHRTPKWTARKGIHLSTILGLVTTKLPNLSGHGGELSKD